MVFPVSLVEISFTGFCFCLFIPLARVWISSLRGVVLIYFVTDRQTDGKTKNSMSSHHGGGDIIVL